MQINDDLFDGEIRRKLKNEINYIPEDINKKIDETVKKIQKKRFNVKKVCSRFAVCIIGTVLFGITMPTYASNIPFIGSVLERLNYKTYEKYASDLNITKESNGLKATINKVVYDGIEIAIFYNIESEEGMENIPNFMGAKVKIDGKETNFECEEAGGISDDKKTYVGVLKYRVGVNKTILGKAQEQDKNKKYIEIPNEFVLSLDVDKSGIAKWSFDIPISVGNIKDEVKEKKCDIYLRNGYHINKIITSPINTVIEGTIISGEGGYTYLNFFVLDDKGRKFELETGSAYEDADKDGKSHMYLSNKYKAIYDDTESLTFIPYSEIFKEDYQYEYDIDGTNDSIFAKLNLQGESKLYSDDGKEYATITRVETISGKTKIYYKSKCGVNLPPFYIINNNTGEEILAYEYPNDIIYISNSDEYVFTCDKVITEGDYSIKTIIDKSSDIQIYNNEKFTIKLK